MKPGIPPHGRTASIRPWAVATLITFAFLLFAVGLLLRGCMNQHTREREHAHGDIGFGISPRGDALVFNAVGVGGRDLYLLDLKTRRVTQIASTPDYEVDPQFSPDGMSIVYAAGRPGDRADHVFVRSLDGRTVKQLTAEDANDASPAFSPDGSLIVFTRDKTYSWGGLAASWDWGGVICVIKADGTALRQITNDKSIAIGPHFSPDGKTIMFWSEEPVRLHTVAVDGSQPPRTLGTLAGHEVVYSPDGQSIAFSRGFFAPDLRIVVAKVDGTGSKELADLGKAQPVRPGGGWSHPTFTPDGKRVIFFVESWPTGARGVPKKSLWEVSIDGANPHEIAHYGLFDDPLGWHPSPPEESTAAP
jgi:WD40-like Beta Propeller Repeat